VAVSAKPARSAVASQFKGSARATEGYLRRLEGLNAAGVLSDRDVTRAYEGAFLSYYTDLERHIERLFLGLVMGRFVVSPSSSSLVQIQSEVVARKVVGGGRRYTSWLPIRYTEDRAEVFLSRGAPFDRLISVDHDALERMRLIRNAVAHKSHGAMVQFNKNLIEGKSIPPKQRTPAGYLRGQHAPGQTRLSYLMAQGVAALDRICG
jgi:hypothetical protein